jgi:hypothetical protein
VTVTTPLFVEGGLDGAVNRPPGVIDPLLPLTLQFTSVLLSFVTVAVHWEVPSTVTLEGVQTTVMVGVAVVEELLPQELRTAARQPSATMESTRCHRTWPELHRKFDSNTRIPPTRSTQIFTEEACQCSLEAAGARNRCRRELPAPEILAIGLLLLERYAPLNLLHPPKLNPTFAHLEASRAHFIRKPVRNSFPARHRCGPASW